LAVEAVAWLLIDTTAHDHAPQGARTDALGVSVRARVLQSGRRALKIPLHVVAAQPEVGKSHLTANEVPELHRFTREELGV
jgi:hypothetical protein